MRKTVYRRMKKCIAAVLALAILLQCGFFGPIPVRSVTQASADGKFVLGDSLVLYEQILKDEGNGVYTLTLNLKDSSLIVDENQNSAVSRNDYFIAPADGDYLIQLWGGNGGDGNDTNNPGGIGGVGGYVYGVVTLKKGQALYYQLGGKGQKTDNQDSGGGVNGNGGNGGEYASTLVGGGGGYSAVYLFDVIGEFEDKYLDANGNMLVADISEEDRVSKYIMIAGGGGGGGAGSGGLLGRDAGNRPNGGIGGTIGQSVFGSVSGGTYFAGGNGFTSGNSTTYVGMGGTDRPGETKEAILGAIGIDWFPGMQPNDWVRSYDANTPGGNGGAGNLRGGSGGAGYTGGSGGVQTGILIPSNVGGGGGGSSYVADCVDYDSPLLDNVEMKTRSGESGYIVIAALIESGTMQNAVALNFQISDYFDMQAALPNEDVALSVNDDGSYSITNLVLTGDYQTIKLTLKPKTGFAGGNGVPLTKTGKITFSAGQDTAVMTLDETCSMVNVPLNFTAIGENHMTNKPGTEFQVTDLYENNISEVAPGVGMYKFIEDITAYGVYNTNGSQVEGTTVAPDVTTRYYVGYTVTPQTDTIATVGDVVGVTDIRAVSIITVLAAGSDQLNGNTVTYFKWLNYNEKTEQYILTFEATITPIPLTVADVNNTLQPITANAPEYEIQHSGYYFIQVWGGDGGRGSHAMRDNDEAQRSTGGDGGKGGYIEGFVYLSKGTILNITVGGKGDDGDPETATEKNWAGTVEGDYGNAGGNTSVYVGSTLLLIAGGGGGGGAAWRKSLDRGKAAFAGQSAYNCEVNMNDVCGSMDEVPEGAKSTTPWYAKTTATTIATAVAGSGGTSGNNAGGKAGSTIVGSSINKTEGNPTPTTFNTQTVASQYSYGDVAGTAGRVNLTCLELTEEVLPTTDLSNYVFQTDITQYFEIKSVTCTDKKAGNGTLISDTPVVKDNRVTVSNIQPIEENDAVSFSIDIAFVPKTDFAGGNDVPVLLKSKAADGLESGMRLRQKDLNAEDQYIDINVKGQEVTDYANVVLNIGAIGSIQVTDASKRTIDQDVTPILGIQPENMFAWVDEPTLGADDWRYDYVTTFKTLVEKGKTTDLIKNQYVCPNPLVTTMYTATVGIKPSENGDKAVVVQAVDPVSISQDVEIIVVPRIQYILGNLTTSDPLDAVVNGNYYHTIQNTGISHSATLTPNSGYELPETISVRITYKNNQGENVVKDIFSEVSYNPNTGQFTIPAQYIAGTIVVEASCTPKLYNILFYIQDSPGSETFMKADAEYSYTAGTDLSNENFPANPAEVPGYTFIWDWGDWNPDNGTSNDGRPATMLNKNLIVVGSYVAEERTVIVKYRDQHGNQIDGIDDKVVNTFYGADLTERAIAITGWVLDTDLNAVEQTIKVNNLNANEPLEIIFKYKPARGQLILHYEYANGKDSTFESYAVETGQNREFNLNKVGYSVVVTDAAGNIVATPDGKLNVHITATDAENGISFTVLYTPMKYTLTFDPKGGTMMNNAYQVEFDNKYGYDADQMLFVTFPQVGAPEGYQFVCWYIDKNGSGDYDAGDQIITEENIVSIAADVILYAQWKRVYGTVTIRVEDENQNPLKIFKDDEGNPTNLLVLTYDGEESGTYTVKKQFRYDDNVTYTTRETVISYTFKTQNDVKTVVYYSPKTVTVFYVDTEGNTVLKVQSEPMDIDTRYEISPKDMDAEGYFKGTDGEWYKPTFNPVTGIVDGDKVETVACNRKDAEVTVSVTVSWGTLDFVYEPGTWDPETHQYVGKSIDPSVYKGNTVTVTNSDESTAAIKVHVSYGNQQPGYENLDGYFTEGYYSAGSRITEWSLLPGVDKLVYLWLDGTIATSEIQSQVAGTCIVTITAGG